MDHERAWVALGSLTVLCVGLLGVIVGLIILGERDAAQDAITGLATIGAALSGGLAGWFARGVAQRRVGEQKDD